MNLGLEGKHALVTGAARGIGTAIAIALAEEGCGVTLVDRAPSQETETTAARVRAAGQTARVVETDVTCGETADRVVCDTVEAAGRLDVVVCNAGITRDRVVWKMDSATWDDVLRVNLTGYFNYNRAAARIFKAQGSGKIVNVASINGLRGKFGQANYTAAKAGGIALTKTLAQELGRYGVNVNAVAPGMVRTAMADQISTEVLDRARDETALGRIAEPEDVADAVVWLCSDRARHVTGVVLQVDGGQYT